MRKGKFCFVLLFLVLFYWPNLAQSHTDLFPEGDIVTSKFDAISPYRAGDPERAG